MIIFWLYHWKINISKKIKNLDLKLKNGTKSDTTSQGWAASHAHKNVTRTHTRHDASDKNWKGMVVEKTEYIFGKIMKNKMTKI